MAHLNQNMVDILESSIKIFKDSINGCNDIIKLCSIANVPKMCSIDINKSILLADESIYECEQISDHCTQHLKECQNQNCIKICKELIDSSASAIKVYENIVLECQEQHMPGCLDSINLCKVNSQNLINIINRLLEIN